MKRFTYLLILLLYANCLFAQNSKSNIVPQSQIQVNKEYDENGNITRYDSTYISTWSSDSTTIIMNLDSIRSQMGFPQNDIFDQFFNPSDLFGSNSFDEMQKNFFKQNQQFFNQFGIGNIDSMMNSMLGNRQNFSHIEEIRKQMDEQFKQFFGNDSTQIDFE